MSLWDRKQRGEAHLSARLTTKHTVTRWPLQRNGLCCCKRDGPGLFSIGLVRSSEDVYRLAVTSSRSRTSSVYSDICCMPST